MSIFDLFSKRQKRLRGDAPDVYTYDSIPHPLRVQIVHIWQDTLCNSTHYHNGYYKTADAYKLLVDGLCREYGVFKLDDSRSFRERNYMSELTDFFLGVDDTDKVLDVVELSFRGINRLTRDYNYLHRENSSSIADEAIHELNSRFQEHSIGFQFSENEIIRIDSQLIHSEVVKPALVLLQHKDYMGAQAEFLKAHEHYRHGNSKEALTECLKALESVMKAICTKRQWHFSPNATCNALIQNCFDNGLIPSFWTQQFSSLRSTLESGVPTGRNRLGGHGQGTTIVHVPQHLVGYMLHMTASAIVFLVESELALH